MNSVQKIVSVIIYAGHCKRDDHVACMSMSYSCLMNIMYFI